MTLIRVRVPLVVNGDAIGAPLPTYDMVEGTMQGPKVGQKDGQGRQVPITLADVAAGGYSTEVDVPDWYVNADTGKLSRRAINGAYDRAAFRQAARDYIAGLS